MVDAKSDSNRPTTETVDIVRRLEQVREKRGFATLMNFRKEVVRDGSYNISYATLRRYHRDRTAPADYLLRISEVFDVDFTWLASGFGIAWKEEAIARIAEASKVGRPDYGELDEIWLAKQRDLGRQLEDVFAEHFSAYAGLPPFLKALMFRTWNKLVSQVRSHSTSVEQPVGFNIHPDHARVAVRLAKSLQAPLAEYPVELSSLSSWQLESYVYSICQAVMCLDPWANEDRLTRRPSEDAKPVDPEKIGDYDQQLFGEPVETEPPFS